MLARLIRGTPGSSGRTLAAAALALVLAGSPTLAQDTVLRWAVPSDLGGRTAFHPLANPAAYPREITLCLFNGLTKLDPTAGYAPIPDLAESWEVSADGLTYTFHLRRDVKWHDGEPFTAADVVFTMDVARDPHHNTVLQSDLRPIASYTAPDDHTLVLTLSQPYAPILANLAFPLIPEHIVRPQIADGTIFAQTAYATAPVGTGPFRFVSLTVGQDLIVDANPAYHRGAPKVDRIVFLLRQDPDATLLRLQAGEVDGAQVAPDHLDTVAADARYKTGTLLGTSPMTALLNLAVPPMDDVRVRTALNRYLDKPDLVAIVTAGRGSDGGSPLPHTVWDSTDEALLGFDPAEGDRLLTEAGFAKNAAGIWERGGQPLAFTLHDGYGFVQLSEAMGSQWRKAGVDVTVLRTDFPTIWSNLPTVAAMTYRFGSPSDPDSLYTLFHSTSTRDHGGFNAGAFADPAVDAALDAGRAGTTPEARKAAYDAMQAALLANPPHAWGVVLNPAFAIAADVTGYNADISTGGENLGFMFWNVQAWQRGAD